MVFLEKGKGVGKTGPKNGKHGSEMGFRAMSAISNPTRICTAPFEQVKRWSSAARGCSKFGSQLEGTNLGVFVPIWLVLPRCEATIWVCLICVISPYSTGLCKFTWLWSSLTIVPFSAPCRAGGPKMDLYQVHGIAKT